MAEGQSVSTVWLKGEHSTEPPIQNAVPLFVIERDLVLRHKRSEIEDSLYFLEKRGYLRRHGFQGWTRVAFQLSDAALEVLKKGSFTVGGAAGISRSPARHKATGFMGHEVQSRRSMAALSEMAGVTSSAESFPSPTTTAHNKPMHATCKTHARDGRRYATPATCAVN